MFNVYFLSTHIYLESVGRLLDHLRRLPESAGRLLLTLRCDHLGERLNSVQNIIILILTFALASLAASASVAIALWRWIGNLTSFLKVFYLMI